VGYAGGAGTGEVNGRPGRRTYYVKDNGLGIPEAYRPKVFQAFQRLHPEAAKGEGIGLTLVRRLVERLGGSIWLDSTEGVGSTFFVALPAPPANEDSLDFQLNGAALREQECADGSATACDCVG
jgi:signal transduction histidine kinase